MFTKIGLTYTHTHMYIYIYIYCDWQHWQRKSFSRSTTKLRAECFPLSDHKSNQGTSRQQEYPLKDWKNANALQADWDPWSKQVSASSHWNAYGSTHGCKWPSLTLPYGHSWAAHVLKEWTVLKPHGLNVKVNAMMLNIHTPKKSKFSRKQTSLHGLDS